jgi:argininosuccinate lyase
MVHAGQRWNDQVELDFRLYLKRVVPELRSEIAGAILNQVEKYAESIMPGYTYLQRAQPVTLGHHFAAWCAGLAASSSWPAFSASVRMW